MATVADIAAYFEERVPSSLKLDFDNVGLLCGFPRQEVQGVLLALDVTREVIQEAEELGAQLILTHHPIIFRPLKTVLDTDVTGGRVTALLRGGLSAICLHTNLDIVDGGVNDALSAALGLRVTGKTECGRVAELTEGEPMRDFLCRVQTALGVSGLRFYDAQRPVRRVALCGGAGGELVYEAGALGCDTVLTGEVKYNQWLDGRELGVNIVDADHFCTENVVLPVLSRLLQEGFPELRQSISRVHGQTLRGF